MAILTIYGKPYFAFGTKYQQANPHPSCTAVARGKPLYGLEGIQ
jgi:hypothetical protein